MFTILCLILFSSIDRLNAIHCGFPGRPAYGRALQVADSYSEGQAVTYTCDSGYYMVGPVIRRCLPNGTWTGNMPVCDTTLSPVGYTSSSEALPLYPPELAVDGNKRSCFYSNRRKPRWWRMDMGLIQTVISVSITVPFASSEHHFTIYVIEINGTLTKYHRCASFRGIFSSQSMILVCGNGKGITGSVLHIEDNSPHLDHFGLCEIEVFVNKDFYECGQPEVPTNSYTQDKGYGVEYACVNGYKLEGSHYRTCMRNGQWSGGQPICREVTCPKPQSVENGYYRIYGHTSGKPALGSKVVFGCKPGFNIVGVNDTRVCHENGSWTGSQPECQPIDCGHPNIDNSEYLGGRLKLINSSTKFQSMAELVCFNGKKPGIIIHCRDDGTWSHLEATCLYHKANYLYNGNTSDFDSHKSSDINIATILASVIVATLLSLILLIFFLFRRKILQFKWTTEPMNNSIGRRSSWALEALRTTNIQLRKPFRFSAKPTSEMPTETVTQNTSSAIKSVSSKMDNIYEEIANFSNSALSDETEDKIRRAALIAAEISAINEKKQNQLQQTNPLSKSQTQSPIGLYARVDLIQKHKDRLLRDRIKQNQEFNNNSHGLRKSISSPGPIYSAQTNCESLRVSSLDLSKPHLLRDNMIFVGHPDISSCDTCVTQNNDNSNDKQVYCVH